MRIGIGIGINKRGGGSVIDAQAQAHYDRVVADGGVIPTGLAGCGAYFTAVKAVYGATDINSEIAAAYDADYLGYKLGAGSGTTLGQAAQKLYSPATDGSADVTQGTAANQPLLLVHDGTNNYYWRRGFSENYCSTPNSAAAQVIGNIDTIANITTYNLNAEQSIISKYFGGGEYLFQWINGRIRYFFSQKAGAYDASTTIPGYTIGTNIWVRGTRESSSGDIKYYYSYQDKSTNINDITWIQLGTTISSTSGDMSTTTHRVEVGSLNGGGNVYFEGDIYRVTISNSIGGSPVVDFNPNSYNPATSQTEFDDGADSNNKWTINVDATTNSGYRGTIVDRTYLMSDGVDDSMVNTYTLATTKAIYNVFKIWNDSAQGSLFASNNGAQVIDANLNGSGNCLQYDNAGDNISISLSGIASKLTLRTAVINGASSQQQLNNGTAATGTLSTSTATSMKIFQERNGSLKSKMIFSAMIVTLQADNNTQRTAMYDYLNTINGGALV